MSRVQTVTGPVAPGELGITLTHEHILINLLPFTEAPKNAGDMALWNGKISLGNLAAIRSDPGRIRENNVLDDEEVAAEELMEFVNLGGRSVVDVTPEGIGRDALGLRRIAKRTGLNIIAATGWYQRPSHPAVVKKSSPDELAAIIRRELVEGIGRSGIRAGVIKGACGGPPIPWHPEEKKVLTAACRAQKATGAPFTFHPLDIDVGRRTRVTVADAYVDLIEKEGAAKEKFYLSHADDTCYDIEYHKRLMDRGITLNYDCFGSEVYWELTYIGCRNPSDAERVDAIVELCSQGYEKQIMLSHDICRKDRYRRYGGYTFSHILERIVPRLRERGVTQSQVRAMLEDNPRRVFPY